MPGSYGEHRLQELFGTTLRARAFYEHLVLDLLAARPGLPAGVTEGVRQVGGRAAARWVLVEVQEAYIHCAKHIPRMVPAPRQPRAWGTDDTTRKRGDYFRATREPRPRAEPAGSTTAD